MSDEKNLRARRAFLGLAAASPVAAVTGFFGFGADPAGAYEPGREEMRARYRADSPDVQAFYRTNRYES
jgi:hypothetical protein